MRNWKGLCFYFNPLYKSILRGAIWFTIIIFFILFGKEDAESIYRTTKEELAK
jgi:hypothetical protein